MTESPLNSALRIFEAAEANLVKLEKLWLEMESVIPNGVAFLEDSGYESNCMDFENLLASLPKIDGWKPEIYLLSLNEIGQSRLDAMEVGEIECQISVENQINEPAKLIREYRYTFDRKRRELVRDALQSAIDSIDEDLRDLAIEFEGESEIHDDVTRTSFDDLKSHVAEIDTLLGSEPRPSRWTDLHRHLHFGLLGDLQDIIKHDWPSVKSSIRKSLYGEKEPIPIEIEDLGSLVSSKPTGPIVTELNWEDISPDDFERIIFALISSEKGYENPEWLMKTNAPDRGRDLSVLRVHNDPLGGVFRHRTIIQCKHWLSKSVSVSDIAELKEQMKLWEPPKVDIHVIATSGRFTSDAVALVEKHNQSDSGLRIEMWPESHLERLLSSRPSLIAEFGLR
ncbi:restriction endonuclease [Halomonas sp. YLB-10]|uniref:restriction endonuclease n=1 Tax=Halomonas sp. YLB-10 TaxID=2483111 RepID=UPI000F5F9D82|nr:restriction endonuclease [Halomonas sp. YLB-10]RQW71841.1 restriction endonuclease [Halomonas sp. YLB-10]